jgi:hypothetical protein
VSGALRHPADEPVDDGTATGPAADAGSPDVPPAGPPPGSTDPKLVQYERWFRRLDTQLRMLDRERQKFLAVVNRTDADVFVADPARRIIWTNRGLSKRPSPVAGRPWTGLLCSDFCSHMAGKACGESPADCAVARCLAENAAAHVELHRGGPAGSRELLLSALPIVGPTGSAEEAVVLVQDLTSSTMRRSSSSPSTGTAASRCRKGADSTSSVSAPARSWGGRCTTCTPTIPRCWRPYVAP